VDYLEELDSRTIERLGKQGGFLLSTYHAELAKDPASRATESSRSNVIALWHTIKQIYGKAVARDVANLSRQKSPTTIELTALWDQRTVRDEWVTSFPHSDPLN
jgi:hypothetical protein